MNEEDSEDTSVNYQSGKLAGVFTVGAKIEAIQESYAREIETFIAMKTGLAHGAKVLMDYRERMSQEMIEAKVSIKEIEYGKVYVSRCIELIQKVFNDTEAKRLQAVGAADAMQKMVESAKRVYDEEKDRLGRFVEYSDSEKDPKERPVGYPPSPNVSSDQKPKPKKQKKAT